MAEKQLMKGTETEGDDQLMAATPALVCLSYPCLGSKLKYIVSSFWGLKRMQVLVWNSFRAVCMVFISSLSAAVGAAGQEQTGEREPLPL